VEASVFVIHHFFAGRQRQVLMAGKRLLRIYRDDDVTLVNLGDMEIWDMADLVLLRESLTRLNKAEKLHAIGIDMSHVKSIPSGFFGLLFDWYEIGVQIRLYSAQPNIRRMFWFNHFFLETVAGDCHVLCAELAEIPQEDAQEVSQAVAPTRSAS
jgi:hypothetical protein